MENELFALDNLCQRITSTFNSEIINQLVGQLEQGNYYAASDLLHVMSVSCDLNSPINKYPKQLYDELYAKRLNRMERLD